ncbi:DUF948 domain-containing protein [Geothrix sp. 21YS21S-4]|uniref:DUF948 domain-containing protein n=1 Tax=Geothrix sp. 21YS21S-4 TaxID=3068889 RepID=UPI0027B91546|nr:DUF948 domain-containing protein [Geothrix sp. 21YS21S-4]
MSSTLQIVLILAIVLLVGAAVPLLLQVRRTAQTFERFLQGAQRDLAQIAGDVHASRVRLDGLSDSLRESIDEVSGFARVLGEAGRTVKDVNGRVKQGIDLASSLVESMRGGFRNLLPTLFKSRPAQ